MIWPFKRKPAPINPGPINEDWTFGDLAECITEEWWPDGKIGTPSPYPPVKGDVYKVLEVKAMHSVSLGDIWTLRLGGLPSNYNSRGFRKVPQLNSECDADFAAQIKALKPKRVRA